MRLAVAATILGSLLLGTTAMTALAADQRGPVDIPAQELETALQSFAKERKLQIVFRSTLVKTLRTEGVKGELTADEALRRLLSGTGLAYRYIDEATVTIFPAASAEAAPSAASPSKISMMLAKAEANEQSAPSQQQASSAEAGQSTAEDTKGTPEILVRGSRTLNSDIQRTENDAQPYVVFDRAQIERSMTTNIEDFLRTRLPMNASSSPNNSVAGYAGGNQSSIDLRGLGDDQTLILLNGRRMPRVNFGGIFTQADLNGIPLTAVERIEVLPSTASGIFGGGATGGVVNIITREFNGVNVDLTYGSPLDTHAANRRIDSSAGFSLEQGRTQVMLSASYADADPLLTGERNFAARARALQLANAPEAFYSAPTPPVGYTSNIRSVDGSNLVLDTGAALNSPRTFVPVGYGGPATDNGAALAQNAGRYNLDIPDTVSGARRSMANGLDVRSASLNLRREFTSQLDVFADVLWNDNRSESTAASLVSSTVLPANAANNPFTVPVAVSFPLIGVEPPSESQSETVRATGGFIIRLPRQWSAGADYVWSRSRTTFRAVHDVVGDPDGAGPGLSAAAALANGTLNVMRDINAIPLDYSPYSVRTPNEFGPANTVLKDANIRLSGPILTLPAGPLNVSGLIERREEEAGGATLNWALYGGVLAVPSSAQEVNSYYVEARAPLFSAANARPLLQGLELQASVRRDDYETEAADPRFAFLGGPGSPPPNFTYMSNRVQATKYTAALSYSPVKDLTLRVSRGTGFLPPSIDQISQGAAYSSSATVTDPKRGSVTGSTGAIIIQSGGNPGLLPEDSKSWSAGVVFTPRFLEQLRISVDYTRIEKDNEITLPDPQTLLDLEEILVGRVTRAALTDADRAAGYTAGAITGLNNSLINLSSSRLEAYDTQVDYSWDTATAGRFHTFVIGTWQPYLERQTLPTQPFVDSVGFKFGQLEWRANAGLDWDRGPWSLGWSAQYFHSYRPYTSTSSNAVAIAAVRTQGSDRIASQLYHDMFVRYRFENLSGTFAGALADTEVMLGIQNIFDKSPPIEASTAAYGGYSPHGDPRLRRFTLGLRKSF